MKIPSLGSFEEIVLLTVAVLDNEAYGVSISQEITDRMDKKVSVSALQTALRRLEEKGFLTSEFGEATAVRGGKRKRYFRITAFGLKVLRDVKDSRVSMWNAIPQFKLDFNN